MRIRTMATTLLVAALAGVAAPAMADGPKPVKVSKPTKAPAAKSKPFVGTDNAKTVFRSDRFGASDADTDKLVKKLVEGCAENPFSREGMDAEAAARCNVQVARAIQRGEKVVGPIFRAIERSEVDTDESSYVGYYARTRLFHVLGKIDSQAAEEELLAGMARIAKEKNEDRGNDAALAHEALVKMNGIDPTGRVVAAAGAAENELVTVARRAGVWRSFLTENDGKKKAKIRAEAIAAANKRLKSDDLDERYLGLSALAAQSPKRALPLLDKAVETLPNEDLDPFLELQSLVYSIDPIVPTIPMPRKPMSKEMPSKSPEPPPRMKKAS